MLEQLRREGRISRVGAVFAPKRIGASTLAAMAVPPEKLHAAIACLWFQPRSAIPAVVEEPAGVGRVVVDGEQVHPPVAPPVAEPAPDEAEAMVPADIV